MSETTRDLIAIKVATRPELTFDSVQRHLESAIQGTPVEFSDENISSANDVTKIKKIYKLATFGTEGIKKGKGLAVNGEVMTAELDRDLESAVIGTMALRGAA